MSISNDIDSFAAHLTKNLARDIEAAIRAQIQVVADKVVEDAAKQLVRATGAAYKRGYEEALNDCIRNGIPWARSMFANNAEHIGALAQPEPEFTYAELEQRLINALADNQRLDHEVKQLRGSRPEPEPEPVASIPKERLALNVQHKDCHIAADAFWEYWNANGETHKRGYYESTWGAINRALRTVGVIEHTYAAPTPPAQPGGDVVVTKNEAGQIVAVTRQDDEGRILSVIAESSQSETPTDALPKPAIWSGDPSTQDYASTQPGFEHPALSDERIELTVRMQSFPESNGRRNWTAMFVRKVPWRGLIGNCGGITIARGELWNRVAYEAECAKMLIGERDTEPHILDYGDDIETPEEWAGETRGGRTLKGTP
jgi:hypothetical protein